MWVRLLLLADYTVSTNFLWIVAYTVIGKFPRRMKSIQARRAEPPNIGSEAFAPNPSGPTSRCTGVRRSELIA